jgi:hypothetical protein
MVTSALTMCCSHQLPKKSAIAEQASAGIELRRGIRQTDKENKKNMTFPQTTHRKGGKKPWKGDRGVASPTFQLHDPIPQKNN